jgi:hypothetical protein
MPTSQPAISNPPVRRRGGCLRRLALLFALGFGLLNALAWFHVHAATHFVAEGRPPSR